MIGQAVEIRLLGPLEVYAKARPLPVGPPQQQRLLAALAADAGRMVTVPTLVDRVWDEAPHGARHTLHMLISRLRRVLRQEDSTLRPIVYRSGGYVLTCDPQQVDLHRFLALVALARDPTRPEHDRVEVLRQARDLWRGDPLAGIAGRWTASVRDAWRQQYLDAVLAWAQGELSVGNAGAVIGPLTDLISAYPLVEPLAAALMRAQCVLGRTADALQHYTSIRERLVEQLGVDPGPDLQRLHQAILRGEPDPPAASAAGTASVDRPSGRPVAAQLPLDVAGFTGRREQLDWLTALLDRDGVHPTAVVICVVSGTAGVGKTALAVHWGHQVRGRFPDGQLYMNLRGYDPDQPMGAADVLARLLAALGVPGHDIPLDVDERAARYRTEVAGRRLLIVLDNASTVEQVRPLLPGSPSSVVVVSSRDSLAGLVAVHGARRLDLDLLPQPDAIMLLRQLIGPRVDAEPDAAAALADQCARLPLALRVAAELAAARPAATLAELVHELSDRQQRLDLLDGGGDPRAAVRSVFSWSVRHLPRAAARTFRLHGLHPGPDLDVYAAAALTDSSLDDAGRTLSRLVRAHLVHPTGVGRFAMHDLLRAYAIDLTTTEDAADERRAAMGRLFDYYLATAAAAMNTLHPADACHRPHIAPPATPIPDLTDPDPARSWLDTERPCLVAMAGHTATHGWPDHTVRLSGILFRYLEGGYHTDALTIHDHACRTARKAGDQPGEALAQFGLGCAHTRHGRYGPATDHHERALALFRWAGDPVGEARVLNRLGSIHRLLGRYPAAAVHHQRALALSVQAGDLTGEARALCHLGCVQQLLGRYEPAADHLQRALNLCRQAGNHFGEAWVLDDLGTVQTRRGRPHHAVEHHRRALTLFCQFADQDGQASAHNGLGEAANTSNQPAAAIAHHTNALTTATGTGARDQQARAHTGLAHAHRTLANHHHANHHYRQAISIYTQLGMPDVDHLRAQLTTASRTGTAGRQPTETATIRKG
ncbi:tetratricopeptide repeat protein [Phytohabitans houttuyneae]|uniref:XRE family transcriptional regulator n=2 Tax=Phytohabitans houttuyneae TaxID=1076126 RepID=A0A6V8KMH6_9ACTN|nr:XRE family transcriptional regulator [Phytohabitans houttuyneae]